MGVATQSLSCEISIVQAKNLELKSHGNLFVRYYLSSGHNKRIQINTQEISSKSDLFWNEFFSLECLGTQDSINNLKQESVVFELRWRNTKSILGKIGGSQLLGRAKIPWKTVLESPKMEIEKWVMMVSKKNCSVLADDVKPPSVQIALRVRVPEMVAMEKRNGKLRKWENDDCGCCKDSGCRCQDYEIFASVAAFEAL
ncbi:conserved hypothetical protein [Ricinus communis]|uniref:C2 domain-containing protein n=1 Tax=Ricinus communis TaxID=3988 RepID=B9SZ33_RICCO|nr:conserved hypothetical protein [Ricinus communis]|eukprot:XP_002531252.1 uncharacterized protein LOC8269055 [Ricinus communis]